MVCVCVEFVSLHRFFEAVLARSHSNFLLSFQVTFYHYRQTDARYSPNSVVKVLLHNRNMHLILM